MLSFDFLGKNSYEDFGIIIEKRPSIPLPERNINYIEVKGKSGSLTVDDETYRDITIVVNCNIIDRDNLEEKIFCIKGWLTEGVGDLIFSHMPEKRYIAQVVNRIDIEQSLRILGSFPIIFNCQPFTYPVFNPAMIIEEQNYNIQNIFTFSSNPTITIYGQGDIILKIVSINSQEQIIKLFGVKDYITVDSTLMECYKDATLCNDKMSGDFPKLFIGQNYVSWSGDVERIEVLTNFRFI